MSIVSRLALAAWALLATSIAAPAQEDELLRPEEAFQLEARPAGQGVALEWDIAEGYYLYRDKLRFRVVEGPGQAGTAALPPGKVKDDEFFGPMEIYRDGVTAEVPLEGVPGGTTVAIETVSQGCADIGVCYPPQTEVVRVRLPVQAAARPEAPEPVAALAGLAGDLGAGENEFLDPDVAFRPGITAAPGRIEVRWDIAEGYYLYRDKLKFRLVEPEGAVLGAPRLPAGDPKDDPLFGQVEVYHDRVTAVIPVDAPEGTERIAVEVGYQGCAEAGICYPPQTTILETDYSPPDADAAAAPAPAGEAAAGESLPLREEVAVAEQDRLASLLGESRWVAVLAFFGFGLLLALTPCVFPMIPILSGIIAGQGSSITTRRAFLLSVTYVLAMSVTYTIAGVIAGKFGHNLQAALQNPWMLSSFAAIFVLLSLSMFGFYDLQLPASWQSRLTELSNRQQGGTYVGVAVMGFLSALIVGPCVAPPLAGALIYIGQTGDPWLGGLALFALSLGMGAPLVAVGTLEGKYLPRAGGWMNAVKAVFGVAMLAVAIYLLDRVLPGPLVMALWAALFIVSAIYLGALEPLGRDASGWRKLWKGVGLVLALYGGMLLLGAGSGTSDMFRPLKALAAGGGGAAEEQLPFRSIKGVEGLEQALAASRGQPVMLDFYADWCVACKELEKFTFPAPEVRQALADVVLLKADVTANDAQDQALLKHFKLFGPPAILFFGPDGEERRGYRLVGFVGPEKFAAHVRKAVD